MIVTEQIRTRLAATPAVTAFVGTSPARIFPHTREAAATPAITYFTVDDIPLPVMGHGKSFGPIRVQLSCWSVYYTEAKDMAIAVRNALRGWSNPAETPPIHRVVIDSEGPDLYEPDTKKYHVPLDVLVWADEP